MPYEEELLSSVLTVQSYIFIFWKDRLKSDPQIEESKETKFCVRFIQAMNFEHGSKGVRVTKVLHQNNILK